MWFGSNPKYALPEKEAIHDTKMDTQIHGEADGVPKSAEDCANSQTKDKVIDDKNNTTLPHCNKQVR